MAEKIINEILISHNHVVQKRKISPMHYHNDYELYLLLDGNVKYFIGDEVFDLQKGNLIFVPKGFLHMTDSEECLHNERLLINFESSVFSDDMLPVLEDLTNSKLIYIAENNLHTIKDIFNQILVEDKSDKKYKNIMIENLIKYLLIMLCRLRTNTPLRFNEKDEFMYKISEYISNNLSEDLSLSSISHKFALSEGHLSRKFKAVMGTGLNEYIRYVRIVNGERLLIETDFSVTEISERCGFNDSNYFSTAFKNIIGTSPLKYRKLKQ